MNPPLTRRLSAAVVCAAVALLPAGDAVAAKAKGKPSPKAKAKIELQAWLKGQIGPVKKPKKGKNGKKAKASAAPTGLALVRSYEIPAGDPLASALADKAWTYDSALATIALIAAGDKTSSGTILDQLARLQTKDGGLDFAYNTATGSSVELYRTGSIAWAGLAATAYREAFNSNKYGKLAEGAATWVLARQRPDGLLTGGPDVAWVSTQHNLIAYRFLTHYAAVAKKDGKDSGPVMVAANRIGVAIDAHLAVRENGDHLSFRQGLGDDVQALDVQALGILHLADTCRKDDAADVRRVLDRDYAVTKRSIAKSLAPATFNADYVATGPFSGYRPYAGAGAPDVMWMEGTYQARLALRTAGITTSTLDGSLTKWAALTAGKAALGADKAASVPGLNEYHVWPTSAAASWQLLALGTSTALTAAKGSDCGVGDDDEDNDENEADD